MKKILNFKNAILAVCIVVCCCTIHTEAQDLKLDWVQTIGGGMPHSEGGSSITLDDSGYVYTTGAFAGSAVIFGQGKDTITLKGGGVDRDIFVTKHNATGKLIWARTFPGVAFYGNSGADIKVDKSGNVYVIGTYSGTLFMGGSTQPFISQGIQDIFLVKLDKDGNTLWANNIGGKSSNYGTSLDIDHSGNVYICGTFSTTLFIGNTSIVNSSGTGFAAKFDTNGNFIWVRQLGGNATIFSLNGIVVDENNNTYLTGAFATNNSNNVIFGNITLPTIGSSGALFVVKLDANGAVTWAKGNQVDASTSPGEANGRSIVVDAQNNIYISGSFLASPGTRGAVDFNLSPLPADTFWLRENANANGSAFVLKLDNNGNFIWVKPFLGMTGRSFFAIPYSQASKIDVDVYGNVYTTGHFRGDVDFDPGNNSSIISTDSSELFPGLTQSLFNAFISKLDKDGNFAWVKSLKNINISPVATRSSGASIVVNPNGGVVYTTGSFSDSIDFDPGPETLLAISNLSTNDIYIHKLTCAITDTAVTFDVNASCKGYTINGETYTENGLYYTTLVARTGCDSVISFNLNIVLPEPVININIDTLGTTQSFASYQWLKNGEIIDGATSRQYVVTENADYQVIVTDENGCTGTSEIYEVRNVSVNELQGPGTPIRIYPNPTDNLIHIQSPGAINVMLTTIDGRMLFKKKNTGRVSVKQLAKGIYLLRITDDKGKLIRVEKIIKQ